MHDADYLRRVAETAGRAVARDPDTYTSPETHEIALLAAGAAVDAVEHVLQGPTGRALALVRPPGHHAERARAMGFCLINNVAVAAAHTRALGAERVAIVDVDVHHGNGTQHIFDRDPRVLYISLHQHPFYPGTGAAAEVGKDAGEGFTVNLPLEAGATDDDYHLVFTEVVAPVLEQFKPDVVLVSADSAHERDPLGGMRVTTPAYAAMTGELCAIADRFSRGRIALVTEGGAIFEPWTTAFKRCRRSVGSRGSSLAGAGSVRLARARGATRSSRCGVLAHLVQHGSRPRLCLRLARDVRHRARDHIDRRREQIGNRRSR